MKSFIAWDIPLNYIITLDVVNAALFLEMKFFFAISLLYHPEVFTEKKNLFDCKNNLQFHNHPSIHREICVRASFSEYRY